MDPEQARAEIERARAEARVRAPREERRPDPLRLPELPGSPLEVAPPPAPLAGDYLPEEWLYRPEDDIAVWLDAWQRNLRFRLRSHRGLVGRVVVALKRLFAHLVRAPLSAELDRERIFAIALLQRLSRHEAEVRTHLRAIRDPYSFLRDQAVPDLVARDDALFGILDRRIDALEAEVGRLRGEAARAGTAPASPPPAAPAGLPAAAGDAGLFADPTYFEFETLHRGSEGEVRARQAVYLELFRGAPGPVVDLGSGRGEMLALLAEAGIAAYGVDLNGAMAAACRARGLDVRLADAVTHLEGLADGSLGGAFSAQTFEHWERERIVRAVELLWRKLGEGAAFVMETQNPRSIAVGASAFWRDPTHVRPLHPEAFEFLVRAVGFRSVELRELNPWPEAARLRRVAVPAGVDGPVRLAFEDLNRLIGELDERLYGFRDYAIVARR